MSDAETDAGADAEALGPPQSYSCTTSPDGRHLLGEGGEAFRIDDRRRLVTLIPLPADTRIPLAYRYAQLDQRKQKKAHPRLYVGSPCGSLLRVYGPDESVAHGTGALILEALHQSNEPTCKWSVRFWGDSMAIVLNDHAKAGSVCIV